jgi:hypothetical protein
MATNQTTTISGQLVNTNNNIKSIMSLQYALTPTGSNSIANSATVYTGSWQMVNQGSNSDFRFGYFSNLDTTSSVKLAIASTASYASWLMPGDLVVLTNSGSASIWAQAYGNNGTGSVILQYFLSEG